MTGDPFRDMEAARLRLPDFPSQRRTTRKKIAARNRGPATVEQTKAARRSINKGKSAERDVVKLWRANGWPDASRTPGSGAWRPYGERDTAPLPLDVFSGWPAGWPEDRRSPSWGPWWTEVKHNERLATARGESFIRGVARTVEQMLGRFPVGAGPAFACIFARANREPWSVWVPVRVLIPTLGGRSIGPPRETRPEWVRLDVAAFFEVAAMVARGSIG